MFPDSDCQQIQSQLSEYLDNALPARQMLAVEKHLSLCAACAEETRQLQQTVKLVRAAPRLDTSDAFMAKLHARLDGLEPEAVPASSLLGGLRDAWAGLWRGVNARRIPALGLGVGLAAALGAILFVPRPAAERSSVPPIVVAETLQRNVALAASNPFEDPVAANLEARAALSDSPVEGNTGDSNYP
jgi:anti-sigma factor RsiW